MVLNKLKLRQYRVKRDEVETYERISPACGRIGRLNAGMVELVDTHALGACARKGVQVRVLFPVTKYEN